MFRADLTCDLVFVSPLEGSGGCNPFLCLVVGGFVVLRDVLDDKYLVSEVCFLFWTVLSMITSDNVVEDALRTSPADSSVGIQRRDSL